MQSPPDRLVVIRAMRAAGCSQHAVARALRITQGYVSQVEKRDREKRDREAAAAEAAAALTAANSVPLSHVCSRCGHEDAS